MEKKFPLARAEAPADHQCVLRSRGSTPVEAQDIKTFKASGGFFVGYYEVIINNLTNRETTGDSMKLERRKLARNISGLLQTSFY